MLSSIMNTVDFLGNFCVVLITLYTFYLTFCSKKIKVIGYSDVTSAFEGEYLKISLQSFSMKAFEITSICVITENGQSISLKLEQPTVLEPRRTVELVTEPYTKLIGFPEHMTDILMGKWNLILVTRGQMICASMRRYQRKKHIERKYKKHQYERIQTWSSEYEDVVLSESVRYAIQIVHEENYELVYMTEAGFTNRCLAGYNSFDIECMDAEDIRQMFAELLHMDIDYILITEFPKFE